MSGEIPDSPAALVNAKETARYREANLAASGLWKLVRDGVELKDYDTAFDGTSCQISRTVRKGLQREHVIVDIARYPSDSTPRAEDSDNPGVWRIKTHHIGLGGGDVRKRCTTYIYPLVPGAQTYYATSRSVEPGANLQTFTEDLAQTDLQRLSSMSPELCETLTGQLEAIASKAMQATVSQPV